MSAVIPALAPIFLLIVLGYGLRRAGFVPESFWPAAEKMTYYVFFPCLLATTMAGADLDLLAVLPMAAALLGGVLATVALLALVRPVWRVDGPGFTSIVQGGIRPNTYVGLAAADVLFGAEGLALAAIGIAVVVPLVNVVAVSALARFGDGAAGGLRATLRAIVTNPLILAVLLGLALNLTGLPLPPPVGPMAEVLGRAALPVGLLAVGAGLDLPAVGRAGRHVFLASAFKLVVTPGVTAALCLAFGVGGMPLAVAALYNGLPTSASSYVLARQMGGDATMMAGIITATTLAAMATLPLLLMLIG